MSESKWGDGLLGSSPSDLTQHINHIEYSQPCSTDEGRDNAYESRELPFFDGDTTMDENGYSLDTPDTPENATEEMSDYEWRITAGEELDEEDWYRISRYEDSFE